MSDVGFFGLYIDLNRIYLQLRINSAFIANSRSAIRGTRLSGIRCTGADTLTA